MARLTDPVSVVSDLLGDFRPNALQAVSASVPFQPGDDGKCGA